MEKVFQLLSTVFQVINHLILRKQQSVPETLAPSSYVNVFLTHTTHLNMLQTVATTHKICVTRYQTVST